MLSDHNNNNNVDVPPERFRFLSGPISFVQCIGKVGDVNVNVYILGDQHDSTEGTCYRHSDETIDLTSFLRYNFLNATEKVDFFLEIPYISKKDSNANIIQKRLAYASQLYPINSIIDELIRDGCFFQDKSVCDLKFPNIRFHYADIRFRPEAYRGRMSNLNREIPQYLPMSTCVMSHIFGSTDDVLGFTQQLLIQLDKIRHHKTNFSKLFMINDHYYYKLIRSNIENEQQCQKVVQDIIENKLNLIKFIENEFENNKLLRKEMNGIVDNAIRKKIKDFMLEKTKQLDKSFKMQKKFRKSDYPLLFKEYNQLLNELLTYMIVLKNKGEKGMDYKMEKKISILFNKVSQKYNNIMDNLYFIIGYILITVEAYLMDIYVLARLFKKSMWNNPKTVVIYTGLAHSNIYTEFLLDMMNFKIVAEAEAIDRRCLNISQFRQPLFRKNIDYIQKNSHRSRIRNSKKR